MHLSTLIFVSLLHTMYAVCQHPFINLYLYGPHNMHSTIVDIQFILHTTYTCRRWWFSHRWILPCTVMSSSTGEPTPSLPPHGVSCLCWVSAECRTSPTISNTTASPSSPPSAPQWSNWPCHSKLCTATSCVSVRPLAA